MRTSRIAEAAVGAFVNDLVRSVVRRFGRTVLLYLAVFWIGALALGVRWWQHQSVGMHVLIVAGAALLVGAWVQQRVRHRARPKPSSGEPTQVLYRWWEPDELDDRVCFCGKERVPGELIYIGITGAHRSRELDDDRQAACWWRPGIVGTTETFMTRDEVERAERQAIRSEHPRENKQHARGQM